MIENKIVIVWDSKILAIGKAEEWFSEGKDEA
jgi:hypothetical protein